MKVGLGGGVGPFRAGVSTRGAGVGVGPLSLGFGTRGMGRGLAPLIGLVVVAAAVYLVIAWPYLLGTWAAEAMGASPTSGIRAALGWVAEAVYLLGVVLAVVKVYSWRTRQLHLREVELHVDALECTLTQAQVLARSLAQHPTGRSRSDMKANELLLADLTDVDLVEPRVPSRGEAAAPTVVDTGHLVITDRRLRFVGGSKSVEWQLSKLESAEDRGYLAMAVGNRKSISGVTSSGGFNDPLFLALRWAQAPTAGAAVPLAREVRVLIQRLAAELASARADLV